MSINNIHINTKLLTELYGNVLVEATAGGTFTDTEVRQNTSPPQQTIRYLGKNAKNILIVLANENTAFLEETELNFLTSILNACKLSLADVAIVNLKNLEASSYTYLNNYFKSRIVLLFDVNPLAIDLPFNFPHYQVQQFDNCTYLSAPLLSEIENNKALKQQLWNCLKTIFGV